MKEQTIQAKIIKWLEARGCYVIKTMVTSKAGTPDLIVCLPNGRFMAIEVKCPGGRLSKLQEVNLRWIAERQGISLRADSVQDVSRQLKERGITLE